MYSKLFKEITKRTLKIPVLLQHVPGNGSTITRQLDSALMSVGFKLSKNAFEYFNTLSAESTNNSVINILETVKELVGDHVKHNAYFIDFPKNVPNYSFN
jgi:hypothetical protein